MGEFPNKPTQFSSENQPAGRGRPKGSKNLATIVQELENEDFDWDLVPIKQKDWARKAEIPWRALALTALAKGLSGDTKAMEWLRKSAYGDKLDLTSGGKPIPILGGKTHDVPDDDSDQKDNVPKKKNKGDSGRDVGR